MLNIVREYDNINNVATRDGKIVARMDRPDRLCIWVFQMTGRD